MPILHYCDKCNNLISKFPCDYCTSTPLGMAEPPSNLADGMYSGSDADYPPTTPSGTGVVEVSSSFAYAAAIILALLTLSLYACIANGGDPQPPKRIEYYANDDGTFTPIINGNHTAYHQYSPAVRSVPRSHPTNTTRTTPARVVVNRNTLSNANWRTGSTRTDVLGAGRVGDTRT